MFTRCPECKSVHAMSAALLAHASGRVRCGHCNHAYFALGFLFDEWPESNAAPSRVKLGAGPPMLGSSSPFDQPEVEHVSEPDSQNKKSSGHWITVLVLVALVTIANVVWTFRDAGPESGTGTLNTEQTAGQLDRFHLVSRDLHQHPSLAGTLSLSAVFVSTAEHAQPYPVISLTLTDAADIPLARRQFSPNDYLPGNDADSLSLSPGVHVAVLLEFADPGNNATGYRLEFH